VVCTKCHLRIVIDTRQPDIKYCKCSGVHPSDSSENSKFFLYRLFNYETFYYIYINIFDFIIYCLLYIDIIYYLSMSHFYV